MATRLSRSILILFALGQIAGSCQGTETGNPGVQPGDGGAGEGGCPTDAAPSDAPDPEATAGSDQAVDDLIADICSRLIACGSSATTDSCTNALNGEDGDRMTDEFGLSSSYTVVDWRNGLNAGSITISTISLADCRAEIGELACEEVTPYVAPPDFSGVEEMIPISCASAFGIDASYASPTSDGC